MPIFKKAKTSGSDLQAPDAVDSRPPTKYDEKLRFAAEKGDLTNVKTAFKKGGRMSSTRPSGATAVHLACQNGHMQVVDYIKQVHPECVNYKDSVGRSPVHMATKSGHLLCTQLLQQGRPSNESLRAADMKGLTPLHYAAFGGHLSVVGYLCQERCPTSPQDQTGVTPLMFASANGSTPVVQKLIEHGAEVNSVDGQKKSALMHAVREGNAEIVKVLLQHGAKVDLVDTDNKTAIDYAIEGHYGKIKEDLESAPKVASYVLGVPPGLNNPAVLNEQSEARVRAFSGSSLASHTQEPPQAARQLRVSDRSKSDMTQDREKALQQAVKDLEEENDCLNDDITKLKEEKHRTEKQVKAMGEQLAQLKDSQQAEEPNEEVDDLNMKLSLQKRELHRTKEQLRKAEEELATLRAQLASYQAEDDQKGDIDFSDENDEEEMLPGVGASGKSQPLSPGEGGLLKANRMIVTLRKENEDLRRSAGSDGRQEREVAALQDEVKQLQLENERLAETLEDSGRSSGPTVPLALYQQLQESESQKITDMEARLREAKRSSGSGLERQMSHLRSQMADQEETHNRSIQLYRQHILAAANGYIHPDVQQMLSKISELRLSATEQ